MYYWKCCWHYTHRYTEFVVILQFYNKLEEKHQALQAEKSQYEARTKVSFFSSSFFMGTINLKGKAKRTIFASGGLGLLQMVSELGYRAVCQRGRWAPKGSGL